jgi:hypothetical protein
MGASSPTGRVAAEAEAIRRLIEGAARSQHISHVITCIR